MPLELAGRVEHIESSSIQIVSGKRIMQYLGKGLPIIRLENSAECNSIPDEDHAVIVFKGFGRKIGLFEMRPVDFIEDNMLVDHTSLRRPGIMGSGIIDGNTTMILDVYETVEKVYRDWTRDTTLITPGAVKSNLPDREKPLILVAEDSTFFRKQVVKYIVITSLAGDENIAKGNAVGKYQKIYQCNVVIIVTIIEELRSE